MSLWDAIQGAGATAAGLAYAGQISDKGDAYAAQMGDLAAQLQADSAFTGYGVTTGLGTSSVGADGSMTLGVGQNNALAAGTGGYTQAMGGMRNAMNNLNDQANMASYGANKFMQGAMQNPAQREQDIYNRAMAMQQPGLDAQRAQTNAQEFAAGRGGVMGSQFGGSGEDAAMARAQAQAQNTAAFQAMGQAQQEMMNQGQLAQGFGGMAQAGYGQAGQMAQGMGGLGLQGYQASFTPMQQQLNAMQVAQQNANMAQTGQLTGTGYASQLGLGGIQTAVNADKAGSELYGEIIAAMMNNANSGDGASWLAGILPDF